ncbi:Nup93/Nic96-domain-containing protein [Absidia repens]|uniref:Nuclear pore protein n=1 Tax=Absidia repens TaxID=90262 RepID=A0A1X2I118_9FUNG|nr:Nup93/Nic96-domain-containing protein [Absidia repens]
MSFLFKQLYENSKQLLPPTSSSLHQLPYIERELDQIDNESQLLATKTTSKTYDPYIKAHCLLAQGGVNHQEISEILKKLDTSNAFERRDDVVGANIGKYLERSYEETLKDAFESEHDLFQGFGGTFVKVDTNWTSKAQACLESWDQHTAIINTTHTSNVKRKECNKKPTSDKEKEDGICQLLNLSNIIQKLNDHRVQGNGNSNFDIVSELAPHLLSPTHKATKTTTPTISNMPRSPSSDAEEAQQLLKYITTQYGLLKGDSTWKLCDSPLDANLSKTRSTMTSISRSWLEKQFVRYIDNNLWKHAQQAKAGGNPSFAVRLLSFINFTFRKNDRWIDDRLEIAHGTPIWVYVYMLLRSGHTSLAIKYVNDHLSDFKSRSPTFTHYFMEYMDAPAKSLQRSQTIDILAEYRQMMYGNEMVDPYKLLLFKIIGRCEVNKPFPTIIRSSEDYLWLQLSLIRSPVNQEEYLNEKYDLQDLQQTINTAGPSRYDRNGNNPWIYFRVLLSTLQFEKAISYLYQFEQTRIPAVHYAIALAYYGLLNIPKDPIISGADIVLETNQQITFNFARLIHDYVKAAFVDQQRTGDTTTDIEQAALQYTYLLTLYKEENMTRLAFLSIQNLVLGFVHGESILGTSTPHQGRKPGLIDRYTRILGIQDESEYSKHILHPIGDRLVKKGRYPEAIHVYRLSNDDNKVIDVLIKELGDTLWTTIKEVISVRMNSGLHQHTSPVPLRQHQKSLVDLAQTALQHCDAHLATESTMENNKKHLVRAFILLFKGIWFYEENKYEEAFWSIQNAGILPLAESITLGQIQSMCDQMARLGKQEGDALYKLLPELVLVSTDILYSIWQSLTDIPDYRTCMMPHIHQVKQQVRNLLIFIGLMPSKIPAETVEQLNRVETKMTTMSDQSFL